VDDRRVKCGSETKEIPRRNTSCKRREIGSQTPDENRARHDKERTRGERKQDNRIVEDGGWARDLGQDKDPPRWDILDIQQVVN
jgi:hypothetical protein